jgi:ELWxxDGT repeat protein
MSIFATSRFFSIAHKYILILLILVAFFACKTNYAHAAPVPQLVKNIATTANGSNLSLHTASTSAGFFLLLADNIESGAEWWRSDGTAEGTSLIADIEVGSGGSFGGYYGFIDPYWITSPFSSTYGQELWRTDGTADGTSIILDSRSGVLSFTVNAGNIVQVGNLIYYASNNNGSSAINLWRTDGTTSGTTLVSSASLRMAQYSLVNLNNLLIFSATASLGSNNELWSSNGTATGTVLVKEIRAGSQGSSPANFTVSTTSVFFTANDNLFGNELWKTDGTATGTYMVKDINTGSSSPTFTNFKAHGGLVYFGASDSTSGIELWKSDGTEAGTVMVKDINPGLASSSPAIIAVLGDTIIFTADDGVNGVELWKSDGTEVGTVMIKDINASGGISMFSPSTLLNGTNLILGIDDGTSGRELWKTDGTALGTTRIKDIYTGSSSALTTYAFTPSLFSPSSPSIQFISVGSHVYFPANDGVNGMELWKTDGTEEGTVMVKNIANGDVGSGASRFLFRDNETYFYANDPASNYGIWQTDGTEGAASLVVPNVFPTEVLGKIGTEFYFFNNDGVNGTELWKTDFTEGGTMMVKDINAGSASSYPGSSNDRNSLIINDKLFFSANTATSGVELWVSDGTEVGTVMVKDIRSGATGSSLGGFVAGTSSLYFFADDGTNGKELWTSDGTDMGTYLVKNLVTGASGQSVNSGHFQGAVLNGAVYLSLTTGSGWDLMRTDGTSDGTYLVKNLPSSSSDAIVNRLIVSSNGYLYFVGNSDAGNSNETSLWRSDGTTEGTVPIHQLKTTSNESANIGLVPTTRGIYYSFDHPLYGYEWWFTDGFSTTSTPLADVGSGTNDGAYGPTSLVSSGSGYNSRGNQYVNVGEALYFVGSDSEHGRELWKTDGTPEGTYLAADISEGLGSSLSVPYFSLQENTHKLYFAASTPQYGSESYVMSLTPTTTLSSITTSSISKTGATVSTSITDVGFARATERGFNYGTTLAYGSGTTTTGLYSLSTFEYDMTDLTCNTTYYVQAFAVNTYGTTTQTTSFTTSACDAVATPSSSRRGGGGSRISTPTTPTTPVTPLTPLPTPVATPTTPSTQQTGTTYTRDLSFGSTGTDVIALQRFLNSRGFHSIYYRTRFSR